MNKDGSKYKRILILLILFLFSFFIRFSFISKGPFHYDTLDLMKASETTLDTLHLQYEHGAGYPLTVICGAFFIYIFRLFGINDPVFCVNFMSVFCGSLSVLVLFLLVEKMFNFNKGMFSAIIFSVFAPHVAISTFGKSLTLGILFSLLSAYYMYCYVLESKTKDLIYSALFIGFCAAARLSDALMILPILFVFFSGSKIDLRRIKEFFIFIFIFSSVLIIYYLPMLMQKGVAQLTGTLNAIQQASFLGPFSVVFFKILPWTPEVFLFGGFILAIGGFVVMYLEKRFREFIFLLAWFLITYFFYGNISSCGIRYLVIAWIPLVIAMGYFLGKTRSMRFYFALFLVFIFAITSFLLFYPALEFRHNYALQVDFAKLVGSRTAPTDIIIAMDEDIFIKYYAKRRTISYPVWANEKQADNFLNRVEKILERGQNVYCISSIFCSYDYNGKIEKKLFDRFEVIPVACGLNEDWHHALLNQSIFIEKLYKIKLRQKV